MRADSHAQPPLSPSRLQSSRTYYPQSSLANYSRLMARRLASAPLLSTSRSSKTPIRTNEERRQPNDNPVRTMRFWFFFFIVAFLVFERAAVFAAPSPHAFAKAALSHINTTISRNYPSAPNNSSSQPQFSVPGSSKSIQGDVSFSRPADIAFFLQIAETTVKHLPRLLHALYHEDNVYAIHFDLKIPTHLVNPVIEDIRANPRYSDNVFIMNPELITYRGISMLLNTINAIRVLLDKNKSWDYFINLSGADYPLLNAQTTRKLLGYQLGLNFFTFAPKRTWDSMAENRLAGIWYDESLTFRKNTSVGKLTKLHGRNPLVDNRQFDVSHAEAWMIGSREFCEFVIRSDISMKMLVAFAYAVDSSEHYFASLAWNHNRFRKSLVPHSLRMIIWLHDGVLSGQHPYFIDEKEENGSFKFKDEISKSVLFFARKFNKADSNLMDWIDERAKNKEVIAAATNHVVKKISSRETRLAEL